MRAIVCSFSSHVAELKRNHRTDTDIIRSFAKHPRVSTFDMSEHRWLSSAVTRLVNEGKLKYLDDHYPWHRLSVTDAGKAMLEQSK